MSTHITDTAICVQDLKKSFRTKLSSSGFSGTLKSFFKPDWVTQDALRGISFDIKRGERVAFIGPNGAGKSTTIKILSGILHPSSGKVEVEGLDPLKERERLAYKIGTVFGQRSQLWYHLPARDSFSLLASAYNLSKDQYKERLDLLVAAFDIDSLLEKPVRQMSLGERMRCEVVASFLHSPSVLFLDEPTVGLDVAAKVMIRDLIHTASQEDGTTVLLTSHDTGDMERVCDRVILIDEGQIVIDDAVASLRKTYIAKKIITLQTASPALALDMKGVTLLSSEPHRHVFEVDTGKQDVEAVIAAALENGGLRDISVEDPPMEDVINAIYARNKKKDRAA